MSFLNGLATVGKAAFGVATDSGFVGSLIRTVGLGLALSKLSSNAIKSNNSGTRNIDQGVRLQITPDSQAKIPVLYGQAYFGGNIFDAQMSDDNKTMWFALALSEQTGTKLSGGASSYVFNDIYRNNQRIVFKSDGITSAYSVDTNGTIDNSIDGLFEVYLYAGSSTNGQVPQGYTGTVPSAYSLFPEWTASTHSADNLVFAVIKVRYSRDKNVTELGDILFQVSNNMILPGDVVYDYITSNRYGLGINTDDIDTASLAALNTYSELDVSYNDQGSGAQTLPNRYQINGLIDSDENVLANVENICSAAASWLSYDSQAGLWSVVINRAGSTVANFDDSNVLGNVSLGSTGLTDLYNSVKVEFPHRDLRDSGDFIKIDIPANQRNANEPDNTLVITYDIINEPVQAELLGFIELKQSRVDLVVDFEVDYSYLGLKAGDIVGLTNARLNFDVKQFRIISVSESQSDDGITLSINALEYDADVYSVQNITRFTRSNADGIITIGQIGTPSQPQITKFETNARPRVQLESISPIGVVEALEFWISNDVNTAESSRSYTLLTTQRPTGNETYPAGTNVITQVDSIATSEFVIKSRGINNVLTGPYSDPSVTVVFVPQQTTDAIGPSTQVVDNTGALATALGVLTLLNSLDDLFAGTSGSIFDKIFDIFKDVTGVDLVSMFGGNAASYALSANPRILLPGSNVLISLSTLNVPNATVVPYTITGVSSFEISGASLTGNFTVSNNSATLLINTDGSVDDGTVMTLSLNDENVEVAVTFSDTAISYDVITYDEGTEIEETTKSYNFVGELVEATNDGNGNITVTYSASTEGPAGPAGPTGPAGTDGSDGLQANDSPCNDPNDNLVAAITVGQIAASSYEKTKLGATLSCGDVSGFFGVAKDTEDTLLQGIIERKLFITI